MYDPVSTLLESLETPLSLSLSEGNDGALHRILRAPAQTGLDWAIPLGNRSFEAEPFLENGGEVVGKFEIQAGFLNFRVVEKVIWEAMEQFELPKKLRFNVPLRDPKTAAILRVGRDALREFRIRLAPLHLRIASFPSSKPGFLSPEFHHLVAEQWLLLHRLASREEVWSPTALAKAIEQYTRALSKCWECQAIDMQEDAEQTARHLHVWNSQLKTVVGLGKAILP